MEIEFGSSVKITNAQQIF